MSWFEAWLLVNLGWFRGLFLLSGLAVFIWGIVPFVTKFSDADNFVCRADGYPNRPEHKLYKEWKEIHDEGIRRMIRWTYTHIPIALFFFMLGSLVPSTTDIFKIVAIKHGYEAATSDRAKSMADNSLKIMENTLALLNKKIEQIKK